MYRQVLVREEDRKFQKLFWKNDDGKEVVLCLNTVTFGISSAPFLAIRCIHQLAEDEKFNYPLAAKVLLNDVYVDNLVTGANTQNEVVQIRDQIIKILQSGGMTMRQWASNKPQLLNGLPQGSISMPLQEEGTINTLGIAWEPRKDLIIYSVNTSKTIHMTKRGILSSIATIFDPIGLLSPVIITAKIMMQKIWELKLNWDESLPQDLHSQWKTFENQLNLLNKFSFKRGTVPEDTKSIELHGFCDASEAAYGACIYVRTISKTKQIQTHILCAKSRVAPLKTLTIARLELCGALLLSNLYERVIKTLKLSINRVFFWCDSTITLNWIKRSPNTLKTFVANRVVEIQRLTNENSWRHVRSHDNPADAVSRGQLPSEFVTNVTWKYGPKWLSTSELNWPSQCIELTTEVPETKKFTCLINTTPKVNDIFSRFSNYNRLKRVIAYCKRWHPNSKHKGFLTVEELDEAEQTIIKQLQKMCFPHERRQLEENGKLDTNSKLLSLQPFLDKAGILRVGGRLQNSKLPFSQKHPILLPKHHVTDLIINKTHIDNQHAGPQTTLYALRQSYWIMNGRNAVRKITRKCVKCFRFSPPPIEYVMGNLPKERVTASRPFTNIGVDYCGPFYIKEKRHRNRNKIKSYVAVFVCLVTKAVHLELVSDMTTEAFIAALHRFIGRRGLCKTIHSDNGSNFKGAKSELQEIYKMFNNTQEQEKITQTLSTKGISWFFTPPLSPNFGGLWEAAVKSLKYHLKRIMGNIVFTYEDLNTVIIGIEAILNSRPLTPLSTDPNDLTALSYGHFLIGSPLNSLPQPNYLATSPNRLSHWQLIQKVKRDFWKRWYNEYINHLNVRHKWSWGQHSVKQGTVVLLKDNHLPPLQWALGLIESVHPGSDGVIRTVTVRTSKGLYIRNVKMMAPLPLDLKESSIQHHD